MTTEMELEDRPCPIGCARDDEFILEAGDQLHGLPGKFEVVRCRNCGLMRTNPRPGPVDMANYYPENYGPYLGTQVTGLAVNMTRHRGFTRALLSKMIREVYGWFHFNAEMLPKQEPGRLLEIGCASGAFLHKMATQGWQVNGIEYSSHAAMAASALGYPVQQGSLETAKMPEQPVDLIVGWMVLEHLHDPISALNKLRATATPKTWMVLSVPNAGSLEFKLFGRHWYALQLPTHLYHFTPYTLERLLAKGGWRIERIYHQRTLANLVASIGLSLRDKGWSKLASPFIKFPERGGLWNYFLYPLAWLMSLSGQTGRMTIWAKIIT